MKTEEQTWNDAQFWTVGDSCEPFLLLSARNKLKINVFI